jgi:hypothetical protein
MNLDKRRCHCGRALDGPRYWLQPEGERYSCTHLKRVWRYECSEGHVCYRPMERCPQCVGARPPEEGS